MRSHRNPQRPDPAKRTVDARKKWKGAAAVVRRVIHGWDPYGLLGMGAPDDEWDSEVLQTAGRIREVRSPRDGARVISEVFTRAFQPEGFGVKDCQHVGLELFTALEQARLAGEKPEPKPDIPSGQPT